MNEGFPDGRREVDDDVGRNGDRREEAFRTSSTHDEHPKAKDRACETLSGKSGFVRNLGKRMCTSISECMGEEQAAEVR